MVDAPYSAALAGGPTSGDASGAEKPRVLLVHANPFQRVMPVPPYGLERIRAAAEAEGAEVTIFDPFLVSAEPIEAAAELAARLRPDVIGLGVRVVDDCIIDPARRSETGALGVSWFLPEIRELRLRLQQASPASTMIVGGAAFSAFPVECLRYLSVELGVVGAGEAPFAEMVRRVKRRAPLDGIPGLVRSSDSPHAALQRYQAAVTPVSPRREALYGPEASFPVRTRVGCAMQCSYCLSANMGRRHATGHLDAVLDEITAVVEHGAAHEVARTPVFFADDEFNLPDERHAIQVLEGIVQRGLANRLQWRAYFNPTPLSPRLVELIRSTHGHVSLTVDSVAEPVLRRAQKPFRRCHLERGLEVLLAADVPTDIGLIFGMPGESMESLEETFAFVCDLPRRVRVVYACGARVYPQTPLAAIARAEPERVHGADDPSFLQPVVYSSPIPPPELAQLVRERLQRLCNVEPVSVPYGGSLRTMSAAYRVLLAGKDGDGWVRVLAEAATPSPGQGAPEERLLALVNLALWHSRFDLALTACRRLSRIGARPPEMSRARLAAMRLALEAYRLVNRRRATDRVQEGAPA